jgi:hypothetical protein
MRASNLARKLIALNFSQKVFNFCKIYTPKFLGCYNRHICIKTHAKASPEININLSPNYP